MKNKSRKLGLLFEGTANASSTQIGFFYTVENGNKKKDELLNSNENKNDFLGGMKTKLFA